MTNNSIQVFAGGWKQLQHAKHLQTTPSLINNARGLDMKPDGMRMYTIDMDLNEIVEYLFITNWDSSTILKDGNTTNIAFLGGTPTDVKWSLDGMHCYFITSSPNTIYQLDAIAPYVASDMIYNGVFFSPTEETEPIKSIFILPDEKKFYVMFAVVASGNMGIIYEYDMPSKGDLANSAFSGNFKDLTLILSLDIRYFSVDPGGRYVYVYDRSISHIHRFEFRTLKDISSIVLTDDELDTSDKEGLVIGFFIRPTDGKKLYITGLLQDKIDEYDMSLATNNAIINNDGDELITNSGEVLVH